MSSAPQSGGPPGAVTTAAGPTAAFELGAPACAYWFQPQHAMLVSCRIAQWVFPGLAAKRTAGSERGTWRGVKLDVGVGDPSWPTELSPQHHTLPSVLRAHVETYPTRASATSL